MYGFVNSSLALTSSLFGASVSGRRVESSRRSDGATVPMMQTGKMSKSVPFLLKPKNLDGLPASYEFDPLLISDYINVRFLQEAEIKHGRICMLAAVGFLVQEQFTFGGSYFPKMLPVNAHDFYIQTGGMGQILAAIAVFEAISCYALRQTIEGNRTPGDFGFDPLGLGKDPMQFKKYQANEIMNGRLAMIAVGGFIHQEWMTHQGAVEQLLNFKPL